MIFLTHDLDVENIEVFSSPSDHFLYINCYGLTLTSLWFNPGPSLTDSQSRLTGKKLEELSAGGSQPVPIWRVNTADRPRPHHSQVGEWSRDWRRECLQSGDDSGQSGQSGQSPLLTFPSLSGGARHCWRRPGRARTGWAGRYLCWDRICRLGLAAYQSRDLW